MLKELLAKNKVWANAMKAEKPDYFESLSGIQRPKYLWIGCADSRVPANVIAGLQPGEVFVHRNVANLVHQADVNCLSVLQFAVEALEIDHIIVCGHHNCGGVRAVLEKTTFGFLDYWLKPINDLAYHHRKTLESCSCDDERVDLLCELNVKEQVRRLSETAIIQKAWKSGRQIKIYGVFYDLRDGLLCDLKCTKG